MVILKEIVTFAGIGSLGLDKWDISHFVHFEAFTLNSIDKYVKNVKTK